MPAPRAWGGRTCSGGTPVQVPGRKWCGDMSVSGRDQASFILRLFWTAAPTRGSWVTRWLNHMRTWLVWQAIDMAVRRCPTEKGMDGSSRSDRGSQYMSQRFLDHLRSYMIRPSVGRTGVCRDNVSADSFTATLKNERVYWILVPSEGKVNADIHLMDRAEIQSYSLSLSSWISHT